MVDYGVVFVGERRVNRFSFRPFSRSTPILFDNSIFSRCPVTIGNDIELFVETGIFAIELQSTSRAAKMKVCTKSIKKC